MTHLTAAARGAVLLLTAAAASAAASAPPDTPAAPAEQDIVDATQDSVKAAAIWLATGVDSWFGDRPFEDGGKVSDGRLSVAIQKRQRDTVDINLRFNARFKLPNLEEKTYVFLGRDDPQELVSDKPGRLSRQDRLLAQSNAERAFFFGIGRALNDRIDFRLGFRGGLKPYVQGRYRTQWALGPDSVAEFRQTVFWSLADRAGSTTAFSYEHLFSSVFATRWLSSATVTQASKKFEWSSLLGGYRSFGEQRLLSFEGLVNGRQGSGVAATDYGLQVRWEQPVLRDWLIGGLVVGHFWPRPDVQTERRGAWAAGISARMRF